MGTTWSICKMNMLLHGIDHAVIRQEDTLRRPQHKADNNELMRFDRVLANPPFSQNYIKKDIEYPGRFAVWMPEKGKKADLMFVQHMLAVLKADGKMATVMPHGVLFRGGEEKEARKHFIERGWLEAVIGLPAGLFYGTGIPACVLVMNKQGAMLEGKRRSHVIFINADREYREGKAQNFLRPEDLSKIVHVYRSLAQGGTDVPAYARRVPVEEVAAEDFNCNIRRYVDNAPPPEPHDVRAHLHGGVPVAEIDALSRYWLNYPGLRERCFIPPSPLRGEGRGEGGKTPYADFAPKIADRRAIAEVLKTDPGVAAAHAAFLQTLEAWWQTNLPLVVALAPTNGQKGNVYELRRALLASIEQTFAGNTLLTGHQIRGAFARYMDDLKADLKSIAASGWGAELIPDADILASQFSEMLADNEQKHLRLAELAALLAAADEEDYEDSDDSGVLPGDEVKAHQAQLKEAQASAKLAKKEGDKGDWSSYMAEADAIELRLARHKALEDEAKQLKAELRATEKKQEDLVAAAREKISADEAKGVILERLHRLLLQGYEGYLRADQRACTGALENLHGKYAVTAKQTEAKRNEAAAKLKGFLVELGYE
jgi:type I restriction enzyme M protein